MGASQPEPSGARAIVARLVVCGAVGGVAAGVVELIGAAGLIGDGPVAKAGLFLAAIDGAAGGFVGLMLGLLVALLVGATDVGPLASAAFGHGKPGRGMTLAAYGVAVAATLALVGVGAKAVTADALLFFHHRGLIAALVGAAVAGMALGGLLVVVPLLAAALSSLIRVGRRLRVDAAAPAALWTSLMLAGVLVAGGAVAGLTWTMQARPRMTQAMRALNVGIWSPVLVAVAVGLALVAARLLARRFDRLRRPGVTVAAAALTLAIPVAVALVVAWPTLRQLDRRPFVAGVAALIVAVAAGLAGVARRWHVWRSLALVVALFAAAVLLGRTAATRKAAVGHTGLAPLVVRAAQLAADFDRDGYSSILGGGDCNDFDAEVHPGAFDWPDDGIDQDCNGHQATLTPPPPRHYAAVPPTVPKQPNVILITIDALRADHIGAWGYRRPTTPNLDALAAQSTRFSHAFAHAPSTRYSVPAILIGRYPSQIAVNNDPRNHWPPQVLPENRLISEILKDAGYHTAATLSYHYFERGWGLDQGFDDYDYHLYTLHSVGGDPSATAGSSARELADLDIQWLEKQDKQKPFFLWTHFYDTHFKFQAHPDLPESNFGSDELALYDGEIRFTDYHIGRVLDAVRRLGLWDNTIIVVTSDHGDGFGEHGLPQSQRHGYHLYTNETFVPLIIRVPGVNARVVDVPASHIDILPTVLNALGQPADAEKQLLGQSLFGLMLGETTAPPPVDDALGRLVFQEVWYEGPTSRKAVVSSGWHGVYNVVPDDTRELYDLQADFAEDHDVAGQGLGAEDAVWRALGGWMDQVALPPDFAERVAGRVTNSAPPVANPLGDKLDGLVLDGAGAPVVDGKVIRFDLVMHAERKIPAGWRRFIHVVAANGRLHNADQEPLAGLYPTARLRPGSWLRDSVEIRLPAGWPRGVSTVEVGLFRGNERASAIGPHVIPGNAIRVATVTVP